MTTTRSQWKKQTKQAIEDHQAEANNTILQTSSNNLTNPVTLNCEDINEEISGSCFHETLFQGGKIRQKLSKKQKRENSLQRQQMQTKQPLDISTAELQQFQQEDPTLREIREAVVTNQTKQSKYFLQDGLLYRRWTPPDEQVSKMSIDQLVLPSHCRKTILSLAHEIPLAEHLGQKKTAERILQRFYWPTLFQDVRELCKACPECQRTASGKTVRAPMIPLPIIEEPFQLIAMDIVGPLPWSRQGHRYILVICDYATRYRPRGFSFENN